MVDIWLILGGLLLPVALIICTIFAYFFDKEFTDENGDY